MEKINAYLSGGIVFSNSSEAHSMYEKSRFGEKTSTGIQYSLVEAFYLLEKNRLNLISKNKTLTKEEVLSKFKKLDKKIHIKYLVFKDLRDKGYLVKTALKFGAEFRVYEKGGKMGETHAKWIVFTEHESSKNSWHDFSAKNRVAHSTKKNLLLAIVDDEGDITYYEVRWIKP